MMKTKWTAYALSPIDFGWEHLQTIQEAASKIAVAEADHTIEGIPSASSVAKFLNDFSDARELARSKGWEGDYRRGHEPRVLWIPAETEFQHAFVWKQDNNGSTFVISPVAMPWLVAFSW